MSEAPSNPAPFGCLHCATAGSFKGDVSRMPRTCPTRTHTEVAGDVTGCLGHDLVLQQECHAPVTTLVVKDRALDHHTVAALRP